MLNGRMIIVAEIRSNYWDHEKSNRGMLKLISECSRQTVHFVASHNHIQVIKGLGIPKSVICHEIDVINPECAYVWAHKSEYRQIIENILNKFGLSENDKMFILTATRTIISAAVEANMKYGAEMFFLEHATLENVLHDRHEEGLSEAEAINQAAEIDNTHFLVYSPYAKSRLQGLLTPKAIDKISFLHHPILDDPISNNSGAGLTIGVYGASCNSTFSRMLKMLYNKNGMDGQTFLVIRRCDTNHMDYRYMFPTRGVEMHQALDGVSREALVKYIERMDWILIPYLENQYQVSMSGILSEAIGYEKPVLALNSPIIRWYNQRPIGIVKNSLEELCEQILGHRELENKEKYEMYKTNMRHMRLKGEQENKNVMKNLLKEF